MRRHVRYSALGRSKSVTLVFGAERREAEVMDESTGGFGLRVLDAGGLGVGQAVVVEGGQGKVNGTVLRIESLPDGGRLVGVHVAPPSEPERGPAVE